MNLGQMLKVNAKKFPAKTAIKDKERSFTYPETNGRVNRLAGSLLSMGLKKGDKVAVLLENCPEIIEIYLATAKTGIVIVPINFRLVGKDIEYILNNSDAKMLMVDHEFVPLIEEIRPRLANIPGGGYVVVGGKREGYVDYEHLIEGSPDREPDIEVLPKDPWILIYTSGTTGKPKGVIRSHESHIAFYLLNVADSGFTPHDICLNVMPLCHINSTFYTFTFLYIGGTAYIHPARSFKAEEILEIIEREKITFISLIPTHYNLILNTPPEARSRNVGSIRKLLCSSAPVRKNMKLAILDFFPGVELYEAYGSSEAGIVTILKPEDQMRKLGSIGYEAVGTDFVKIINEDGNEAAIGEVGELYSRGPMLFDGYHKMPEKTASSFRGEWFSAGDLARRDEDGYYQIVDRKDNMIITGMPDEKWGEKVVAVVIPKSDVDENTLLEHCRDKLAAFKRPKQIIFIKAEEMPRTPTGKILHRVLRDRYCG
jgi:acyl-CoA synthetase (AMP-forming)/AMP-acid ligase II